jgi:polyphosphate kinase
MTDKLVTEAEIEAGFENGRAHSSVNGAERDVPAQSAGMQTGEATAGEVATGKNGAGTANAGQGAEKGKKERRTRRRAAPASNGAQGHAPTPAGRKSSEDTGAGAALLGEAAPDQAPEHAAAMSERYLNFLHNFLRDRTLPPNLAIESAFDITTLSIDELSTSEEVYNRELSWLSFNWRVLHEAVDPRTPLLERLKFIAITSSNLDEYFSKRVGGLKRQKAAGVANLTLDGWAPDVQLALIAATVREMISVESDCLHDDILPALAKHGIRVFNYHELTSAQHEKLTSFYQKEVYPILTPLAVAPGHPFPFISNLSLSLGVVLRDPQSGDVQFARVKVPQTRQRWVPLDNPMHFVPLEQVITANLDTLFKGMEVLAVYPFRVTRNADLARNEEEADDLLEMISEELRERRFAPVVRLEVDEKMPADVLALLQNQLHLDNDDVYHVRGLLRRVDLFALADINLPHLKYEPWTPLAPSRFAGINSKGRPGEMFSAIRQGDIIVHHPYQSFQGSTQMFVEAAARDSQVLAIKQTLYRTSDNSQIIAALIQAAEMGKQVAVLVEVKARFDEAKNIEWARKLEEAGCHVAYGLVGLKTHCKVSLAIRQEEDGLRTYYHIGTGNYNAKTAFVYTDLGYFSCNPEIGADLLDLFNYLTGYSYQIDYRKLLVAPVNMRNRFMELIDREIAHAAAGRSGRIIAKMNGLEDPAIVRKLYEASQAGVEIDLIVRGNCRVRPGIPGVSDNIRVVSIIGRFLEHSRIFYFHNDGTPQYYIGSADWMRRNLSSRVEAATPIEDPRLQEYLWFILQSSLQDHRQAWEMLPDGRYRQRLAWAGSTTLESGGVQAYLMQYTRMTAPTGGLSA